MSLADNEREMLSFLKPGNGNLAIDVGANAGAWSRELLQRFDFVHAIEPQEEMHGELERLRVEFPSRFTLHKFAAWGNAGILTLQAMTSNGITSVKGATTIWQGELLRTYTVPCLSIDALHLYPDFIKIDTEGAECEVLKGLQATLGRCHPRMIVEYHARENKLWVEAWLTRLGYSTTRRPLGENEDLGWILAT